MGHWLPIAAAAAWAITLGVGGGVLTEIGQWYHDLRKPAWQPPNWAFGPIWTIILTLAAWAAVLGWRAAASDAQRDGILVAYGVNFVCHAAWSPLFFALKRPDWSLVESFVLLISVLAMIVVLAGIQPLAAVLLAPYALWVAVATVLNRAIVVLNGPFGDRLAKGLG